MAARYDKEVRTTIVIPGEAYKAIRMIAVHRGVSAAQVMTTLIASAAKEAAEEMEKENADK